MNNLADKLRQSFTWMSVHKAQQIVSKHSYQYVYRHITLLSVIANKLSHLILLLVFVLAFGLIIEFPQVFNPDQAYTFLKLNEEMAKPIIH